MNMGNGNPETKHPDLDQDIQEVHEIKTAAMELLFSSHVISREVQMQLKDIFDKAHVQKIYLMRQLSDYLAHKNSKIFEADNLMKQGHELGKSASIALLQLSDEDMALLEWFQQVRA